MRHNGHTHRSQCSVSQVCDTHTHTHTHASCLAMHPEDSSQPTWTHTHRHTHTHIHTHTHTHTRTHTHTHTHAHSCVDAHILLVVQCGVSVGGRLCLGDQAHLSGCPGASSHGSKHTKLHWSRALMVCSLLSLLGCLTVAVTCLRRQATWQASVHKVCHALRPQAVLQD